MKHQLEICCGTWQSAQAAAVGGAHRIELCSALSEGGITPSVGLLKKALTLKDCLNVHVLIRPRSGDFVYTPDEVELMCTDIRMAVSLGADGVVIGALTPDGDVDTEVCRQLVQAAQGVQHITFHRAFDMCRDARSALQQVISLGCDRILTSGLAPTAQQGIPVLKQLVEWAEGRISIMPGSGVGVCNAHDILQQTGVCEIHASARSTVHSTMRYHNPTVSMGAAGQDEYSRLETDPEIVRSILLQLQG